MRDSDRERDRERHGEAEEEGEEERKGGGRTNLGTAALFTCTLRAPVSPKCVVSPLPSGLPYCVTLFGSILKTAHIQSEYWVSGRPTQAMMTRQHQNVTCGA